MVVILKINRSFNASSLKDKRTERNQNYLDTFSPGLRAVHNVAVHLLSLPLFPPLFHRSTHLPLDRSGNPVRHSSALGLRHHLADLAGDVHAALGDHGFADLK